MGTHGVEGHGVGGLPRIEQLIPGSVGGVGVDVHEQDAVPVMVASGYRGEDSVTVALSMFESVSVPMVIVKRMVKDFPEATCLYPVVVTL